MPNQHDECIPIKCPCTWFGLLGILPSSVDSGIKLQSLPGHLVGRVFLCDQVGNKILRVLLTYWAPDGYWLTFLKIWKNEMRPLLKMKMLVCVFWVRPKCSTEAAWNNRFKDACQISRAQLTEKWMPARRRATVLPGSLKKFWKRFRMVGMRWSSLLYQYIT